MYKVNTIASYFINSANNKVIDDDGSTEWISHLKLQKILYFSQAVFLSIKWRELFKEDILAWKFWPVIESIYQIYSRDRKRWSTPLLEEDILDSDFNNISSEDKKLLDEVYKEFWKYSAWELVDITHSHKPWKDTFRELESNIIPKNLIKDYYKGLFTIED